MSTPGNTAGKTSGKTGGNAKANGPDTTTATSNARTILHVDMDAFYVAVEVLLDPSLAGKAVIVGGDGARGVVASCSYEARRFGVHSAMPSVRAKRLCPHAIFLRGNHGLYGEYSEKIHEVFQSFTPLVEGIALDEAFLDVTGARRLRGSGSTIAKLVRTQIFDDLGLPCSVGVATNKLLAKLASKLAKPPIHGGPPARVVGARRTSEGVLVVPPGSEHAFLAPLPVRSLWGVGPKTFERLARFGVMTVGDLARLPEETLSGALGGAVGSHLHLLAQGIDDRPVEADREVKSIGHEETFSVDYFDDAPLARELLRLADAVTSRARHASVAGRTINLKVKFADFRLVTRARTMPQPVATATVVHDIVVELLRASDLQEEIRRVGVRLIGVSLSNLVPSQEAPATQLDLFASVASAPIAGTSSRSSSRSGATGSSSRSAVAKRDGQRALTDPDADVSLTGAVDAIRARFGAAAVGPASLVRNGVVQVKQAGDTQWGPNSGNDDATSIATSIAATNAADVATQGDDERRSAETAPSAGDSPRTAARRGRSGVRK